MIGMTTASSETSPEIRLTASIRALKAARKIGNEDLARCIGVSRSTWFDKMRTGQFTVGEAVAIATYLGVQLQTLVDGQLTVARVAAELRLIQGDGTSGYPRTPLLSTVSP